MDLGLVMSLGLVLLLGFLAGLLFEKIKLPKIVGMIIVGILLGPSLLNVFPTDSAIQNVSSDLRMIALVIILTRSGLSLDIPSLKKIGLPAVLMCFIPATFEIAGAVIFAPILLPSIDRVEAVLLGATVAAVSPAIIVPRMINLMEKGYGQKKQIPKLILAGSSVDDVFVIVIFYAFLHLKQTNVFNASSLLNIPVSIVLGILLGVIVGFAVSTIFKRVKINVVFRVLITLSLSFLMVGLESLVEDYVSISGLLGVISMGIVLLARTGEQAHEMQKSYNKLWNFFEIILFVLVGAKFDFSTAVSYGWQPFALIGLMLLFRSCGVFICMLFTKLNVKERIFAIIAYLPKATVQASIGGICLDRGLKCGSLVLSVAVISIIVTAPIGSILIDTLYKKLLKKDGEEEQIETTAEAN